MTEVRPEPPTAPRAPQCPLPTAPSVCALGWVKCREHITLLVILCIIVFVTNKAHLSIIIIIYFFERLCICFFCFFYTMSYLSLIFRKDSTYLAWFHWKVIRKHDWKNIRVLSETMTRHGTSGLDKLMHGKHCKYYNLVSNYLHPINC